MRLSHTQRAAIAAIIIANGYTYRAAALVRRYLASLED